MLNINENLVTSICFGLIDQLFAVICIEINMVFMHALLVVNCVIAM